MLANVLEKQWTARRARVAIDATMRFSEAGLVLGAGTVLPGAERRDEHRLAALLAAAHLRTPSRQSLNHLRKAAQSWRRDDAAMAAMHLALSGLGRLEQPASDAQRLFLADQLLEAGLTVLELLGALGLSNAATRALGKNNFNPDEPRLPQGDGRASGQWTDGGGGGGAAAAAQYDATPADVRPAPGQRAAPRPDSTSDVSPQPTDARRAAAPPGSNQYTGSLAPDLDLGRMSDSAAGNLARFLVGAIAELGTLGALGLGVNLAFPSRAGPTGTHYDVKGPGDISFYFDPDVTITTFYYTTPDGVRRQLATQRGPNGTQVAPDGRVIARALRIGGVVQFIVNTATLVGTDRDQGRLCPSHTPDQHGPNGLAYENYMKSKFNPNNPTPSEMGYAFTDPSSGLSAKFDDCQQETGILAEYKGPGYEKHFLKDDFIWRDKQLPDMLDQARRQYAARGNRQLIWFFSDRRVYLYMRSIFASQFPDIQVVYAPMRARKR